MDTGKIIKERRELLGITVEELAAKIGKNRATVYRYENGEIENLPLSVLCPIAKALFCTPAQLMGWDEKTPSDQAEEDAIIAKRYAMLSSRNKKIVNDLIDSLISDQ